MTAKLTDEELSHILNLNAGTRVRNAVATSDVVASMAAELLELRAMKTDFATYGCHNPSCPKMRDHACTCGMDKVRVRYWGSTERPAPEPKYIQWRDGR